MVRDHPTVDNILSALLDFLLELWIYEPSFVRPVGIEPSPLGGRKELIGLLEPKGFLRWFPPHDVGIELVKVVIHKYSGCQVG